MNSKERPFEIAAAEVRRGLECYFTPCGGEEVVLFSGRRVRCQSSGEGVHELHTYEERGMGCRAWRIECGGCGGRSAVFSDQGKMLLGHPLGWGLERIPVDLED